MCRVVALCVGLVACLTASAAAANKWKYQVKYGGSIIFNCSEPNAPVGATPTLWMLPDLKLVNTNYTSPDGTLKVLSDGWQFQVKNVSNRHFGLYHCVLQKNDTQGGWFMIKRALNIDGPYFGNLPRLYRDNIIYGFVAMGSFLLFIAVVVLTYTYRWRPPPQPLTVEVYQLPYDGGAKTNPNFLYDHEAAPLPEKLSDQNGAVNVTQM